MTSQPAQHDDSPPDSSGYAIRIPGPDSGFSPAGAQPADSAPEADGPYPDPEPVAALTAERLLLRHRDELPEPGWRRWAYRLSGRTWRPGEASTVTQQRVIHDQVRAPLPDRTRFVAVLARKGGVGKTTTAALLGMTLASLRQDRIVALDANPDRGTLADRIPRQTPATVWDVVAAADRVATYTQMSTLVSRDRTRLDVIASETDPLKARAFREADFTRVSELLTQYYSVVITDCGTDFTHDVVPAILKYADAVVVVAGASVDEATLADETLDMIAALGYPQLAQHAVIAVQSPRHAPVDVSAVAAHFQERARGVVRIPRDAHLAEGSLIDLDRLTPQTRWAAVRLAALVVQSIGGQEVVTASTKTVRDEAPTPEAVN